MRSVSSPSMSKTWTPLFHTVTTYTTMPSETSPDSFMFTCWKARLLPALTLSAFSSSLMALNSNWSIFYCFVSTFSLHTGPWTGLPHVAKMPSFPIGAAANYQMTVKTCSPALNPSRGGHRNPLGCPYQLGMRSGGSADPGGSQADCAAHPRQENPL